MKIIATGKKLFPTIRAGQFHFFPEENFNAIP